MLDGIMGKAAAAFGLQALRSAGVDESIVREVELLTEGEFDQVTYDVGEIENGIPRTTIRIFKGSISTVITIHREKVVDTKMVQARV